MAPAKREREGGVALPLVMMVGAVVLIMAVVMVRVSVADLTFSTAQRSRTRAFYAAEMGLARAFDKLRTDYHSGRLVSRQPLITYQGVDADATGSSPAQKALPDETFDAAGNFYETTIAHQTGTYRVRYRILHAPWAVNGADALCDHQVEAVAREVAKGTWSGVRTTFTAQRTMMYHYGVFFEDDLEILPGAAMTFAGPVHTNANMFLGGPLTFDADLTSAGHMFRGRKDRTEVVGTVQMRDADGNLHTMTTDNDSIDTLAGFNPYDLGDPTKGDGRPDPTADTWAKDADWRQEALDTWDGRVRDVAHGVTRQTPPAIQSIERGGYYEQNAGLKIITKSNGRTEFIKADGTRIRAEDLGAANPVQTAEFYNSREDKTVKTTDVNLVKLKEAGLFPANGTIYATREDAVADSDPADTTPANSRRPHGIRLVNGSKLPEAMIFVSNNPVYVQGDFNRHRDANGKKPGQNGYNPATDTWKPSAILSDATTVLSNAWRDADNRTGNNRGASDTEVNAILITGNRNSNLSEGYSGGLENFPRFLENWGGDTLTFRGSMIQLWQSRFATGRWQDTEYSAPNRDWGYDPAFASANIPPGFADLFPSTTRGVTQGKWEQLEPGQALLQI